MLHIQVNKTRGIVKASNAIPYIRRGAQDLPVQTPEEMRRLEYIKGVESFEVETMNFAKEVITETETIKRFIAEVVPTSTPEAWTAWSQCGGA